MIVYGGYWSPHPYVVASAFLPMVGLSIVIGEHAFHEWSPYHEYVVAHVPLDRGFAGRHVFRGGLGDHGGDYGHDRDWGRDDSWHSGRHGDFRGARGAWSRDDH
jgi:hypothetical protein